VAHDPLLDTSTTFVQRLGNQDPVAWELFASKYTWLMRRWMQAWNIPTTEVEDILQDTFIRVLQNVHNFERQGTGTFRVWLKRISRNCWLQSVRKAFYRSKHNPKEFDLEACLSESTLQFIDTQIHQLIERETLEVAIQRTRQNCNEQSWEAYRLMMFDRCSGQQTAELLGLSLENAYKSKNRFEKQLQIHLHSADHAVE
jgi:RNA polymerase sigma factor (sigma-70 family)